MFTYCCNCGLNSVMENVCRLESCLELNSIPTLTAEDVSRLNFEQLLKAILDEDEPP